MILTTHNQLTLLHDLLHEQIVYQNVTTKDFQRLKSLIRSIMSQHHMKHDYSRLLPEIYYYSMVGEKTMSTASHVYKNKKNIKQWMYLINQMKKSAAM